MAQAQKHEPLPRQTGPDRETRKHRIWQFASQRPGIRSVTNDFTPAAAEDRIKQIVSKWPLLISLDFPIFDGTNRNVWAALFTNKQKRRPKGTPLNRIWPG